MVLSNLAVNPNYFRNLPWGEADVEQNTGQYDNPYKFNGKELDEESGLYYYGARYYNPRLSIWYGVDPLAEDYPGWSPYAYVFDNPLRFTDPTGMSKKDWVYNSKTNSIYWNESTHSQASAGANETYLGKLGTYTSESGTTMLYPNGSVDNNSLLGGLGVMPNLDALINAGANGPMMSYAAFGTANDPTVPSIRQPPNYNSPEYAKGNPSGKLAVAGLYGLQGGVSGIVTEAALAKIGFSAELSWSVIGSKAGDALGSFGVQTAFSSGGI